MNIGLFFTVYIQHCFFTILSASQIMHIKQVWSRTKSAYSLVKECLVFTKFCLSRQVRTMLFKLTYLNQIKVCVLLQQHNLSLICTNESVWVG